MKRLNETISNFEYVYQCLAEYRRILELGDCNDCGNLVGCECLPKIGDPVRYNCPFYKKKGAPAKTIGKEEIVTWGEMYKKWAYTAHHVDEHDWRPIHPAFTKDLEDKSGIIIWLKNGDTIIYYPNTEKTEEEKHES